jgi:hypothetical protein
MDQAAMEHLAHVLSEERPQLEAIKRRASAYPMSLYEQLAAKDPEFHYRWFDDPRVKAFPSVVRAVDEQGMSGEDV